MDTSKNGCPTTQRSIGLELGDRVCCAHEQVLTAITVWCDRNGREAFLGLLPAVRIDQLYVHELEVMAQHAMVLEHPAALDQVHAALAAAYSPDNPQRNPQWGPRCSTHSSSL